MTYNNIRNSSYIISIGFHLILLVLFLMITFDIDYSPREFVEVGFGTFGEGISAGGKGTELEGVQQQASNVEKTKVEETPNVVKEVELPKTKNTETENVIKQADKIKEDVKQKSEVESSKNSDDESNTSSEGIGNKGEGEGSFGYDIDWGGKGTRKIFSYILPAYPEGVSKEIDVKLRFTILPDGTVGRIFPLIKADTRLENAAINSLRSWRFEPLHPNQKQVEQTAVIVFPYRLQ